MASSLDGVVKVFETNAYAVQLESLTNHTVLDGDDYLFDLPPVITSVYPDYGYPGDMITVTGTGFRSTQGTGTITVCGATATVLSWSSTEIVVIVPDGTTGTDIVVTGDDGTDTIPFDCVEGRVCRFVDYDWSVGDGGGNILLDINDGTDYCIDEIEYPIPRPRIEWRDPSHGDGRDVSYHKYENRIITIRLHVFGADEADVSTNARALWEELLRESPILEWRPSGWTDPFFFDLINPPIEINTPSWFETWMRENDTIHVMSNVEIVCEAKPFARGAEETVVLVNGIAASPDIVNCVQGIVVPPGAFLGDVPAPADIYIDLVDGDLWTDLIFGQRLNYHVDFDPIQDIGVVTAKAGRLGGDYTAVAAIADLLADGNFDEHGATSGNTTDWDHWAETRTGTNAWLATDAVTVYTGTHSVKAGVSGATGMFSDVLVSDSVAITTTKTYFTQLVYGYQSRPHALGDDDWIVRLEVLYYNGGAYLGQKTIGTEFNISLTAWEVIEGYVYPGDFPATATHIKVRLRYESLGTTESAIYAYFGQAVFAECVGGTIQAEFPIDSHEGRYLPVGAVSYAATNANSDVTFQAMLATLAGTEITPSINPLAVDPGDPIQKFVDVAMLNPRIPVITIPTHKISNLADKANILQLIRLSTETDNAEIFWYDYLGIVPIDRAYSEVRNWSGNDHLILDGRSSQLALTSLTGSLDDAQTWDISKQKGDCAFVADPNGFNGAIVALTNTSGDYEVTSVVDVTMKYSPLYLLVPEE